MKPATKRRMVTTFQRYAVNPVMRLVAGYVGPVLLETRGRRTGRPRRTPVGAIRRDGSLWVVSEQGHHANYVRNIEADPTVRVRTRGRWLDATAHVLPDADPRPYTRNLNGMMVRLVGTDLLVVRIDPTSGHRAARA